MFENEIETKKPIQRKDNSKEIRKLYHWFLNDYPLRLQHIERCRYLGITPDEPKIDLEKEDVLDVYFTPKEEEK